MQQDSQSVAFVTLGCAKNEVDTDKMAARLTAGGFTVVDDPDEAALVVVNTCAFLVSAVNEGLETIFDVVNAQSERERPAKVLVAGCMPSRYGEQLEESLVEVDGFVSIADEEHIVEQARRALGIEGPTSSDPHPDDVRFASTPSAYVKISDGCDRFCSYCMIPHIRGRYASYEPEAIFAEVGELVSHGTREIVFIGQDTGIWGYDLSEPRSLAWLLETCATRWPDTWFRVLYLQPEGISDELLDCIAAHGNICSYLDMPLQHVDEDILHAMNRSGSAQEYLELLSHVRERVSGIVCRTTFMVGFPGETDEQFQSLLDFAQGARFDFAGVFAYSQEEGSAAAAFEGQVPEEVKLARAQALQDACDAVGAGQAAEKVGMTCDVLVEGYEETDAGTEALARTQGQAPEVDGQVHVPLADGRPVRVGDVVRVTIADSFFYELVGEMGTCA